MSEIEQANVDVVARAAPFIFDLDRYDGDAYADDFLFHFFNPQLPDLAGDYRGLDRVRDLFTELTTRSKPGFQSQPHSLTPFGDELVVAYATHTVGFGDVPMEVDAVVVWRVVDGQLTEAWDIPAVNTVRFV